MRKSDLSTKITKDTKGSDNQTSTFVLFVSFVVKIVFHICLPLCRARR
jgi:hypothetical protein